MQLTLTLRLCLPTHVHRKSAAPAAHKLARVQDNHHREATLHPVPLWSWQVLLGLAHPGGQLLRGHSGALQRNLQGQKAGDWRVPNRLHRRARRGGLCHR